MRRLRLPALWAVAAIGGLSLSCSQAAEPEPTPVAKAVLSQVQWPGGLVIWRTTGSTYNTSLWSITPIEAESFLLSATLDDGERVAFVGYDKPYAIGFVAVAGPSVDLAMVMVGAPEPPEPPPPPPKQTVWITIIEETGTRTPETASILLDLRIARWLKAGGHKMRAVDDDQTADELRSFIARADGKSPYVIISDTSAKVLHEGMLPDSAADGLALFQKYGGE